MNLNLINTNIVTNLGVLTYFFIISILEGTIKTAYILI